MSLKEFLPDASSNMNSLLLGILLGIFSCWQYSGSRLRFRDSFLTLLRLACLAKSSADPKFSKSFVRASSSELAYVVIFPIARSTIEGYWLENL